MSNSSDSLISFLHDTISIYELPDKLTLPQPLSQQMNMLWQRSVSKIEQGIVQEWGGVLILDEQERLRLTNLIDGTDQSLLIQYNTQEGIAIGSFHTHPYVDGTTGIGFSGADIADMINQKEKISLVQSGDDIFALMRTENTPTYVDVTDMKQLHLALLKDYFHQGLSIQRAVHYTNMEICENYWLAFYMGRMGQQLEEMYRP